MRMLSRLSTLSWFVLALVPACSLPVSEGDEESQVDPDSSTIDQGVASTVYEGEDYTSQSGCARASDRAGFSGRGFVDFGSNGSWIQWNDISAAQAGRYTLAFRYANGGSADRPVAVKVNNGAEVRIPFARTGAWTTWSTATITVQLQRGNNTVRVTANTDAGGPNLDKVTVGAPAASPVVFDKPTNTVLRVASYNVLRDSVFDGARRESFARVARAVDADIWCMQEVSYGDDDAPDSEGRQWVAAMRDVTGNPAWNYSWDKEGRYLLSLYPIVGDTEVRFRVHATVLDLGSLVTPRHAVVVNVHFAPGNRDSTRRDQAAAAVDFINRVRNGQYSVNGERVSGDATIITCGDFNAGPTSRPYKILNSLDTRFRSDSFNPSYTPQLLDVRPVHWGSSDVSATHGTVVLRNGAWSMEGSTLDYLMYRSGSLVADHKFILNTLAMSNDVLNAHGLRKTDVAITPSNPVDYTNGRVAVDHLPIVVDFRRR